MAADVSPLKTYPPTWQGELLLACRKCQKKLKHEDRGLSRLKKTVSRRNKAAPGQELRVVNVPCMDLCPKGGVTVCLPERSPVRLAVLREVGDLDKLQGG